LYVVSVDIRKPLKQMNYIKSGNEEKMSTTDPNYYLPTGKSIMNHLYTLQHIPLL